MKKLTKLLAFIPLAFLMVGCGEKKDKSNGSNSNSDSIVSVAEGDFIPVAYKDDYGYLNRTELYSGKDGYAIKTYVQIDGAWYEHEVYELIYDSNKNLTTEISKKVGIKILGSFFGTYYGDPDDWSWYGNKYEYEYEAGTKNESDNWELRKCYSWDNETNKWELDRTEYKNTMILDYILSDAKCILLEAQVDYPNLYNYSEYDLTDEGSNKISVSYVNILQIDFVRSSYKDYNFSGSYKIIYDMNNNAFSVELDNFYVNGKKIGWNPVTNSFYIFSE